MEGGEGGAPEGEAGGGQRPGHMQEFGLCRKSIKKGETSLTLLKSHSRCCEEKGLWGAEWKWGDQLGGGGGSSGERQWWRE